MMAVNPTGSASIHICVPSQAILCVNCKSELTQSRSSSEEVTYLCINKMPRQLEMISRERLSLVSMDSMQHGSGYA